MNYSAWIEIDPNDDNQGTQYIAGQRAIDEMETNEARFYRERRTRQIAAEFTARSIFEWIMESK